MGNSASNGNNDIVDNRTGAGLLVSYQYDPGGEPTPLPAEYVYWGYQTGPPTGSIEGEVDAVPWLECSILNPGCGSFTAGAGQFSTERDGTGDPDAGGAANGSSGFGGSLGEEIRSVRSELAAQPTARRAPSLVRRLGSLHRRDRNDATGEHAATFALLRALRGPLATGSVPEGQRPVAETALEIEAIDGLVREAYDDARGFVALSPMAADAAIRRRLAVVGAFLEAQAGDYASAAQSLTSAAQTTPSSGEAGELLALADLFAERAAMGFGAGGALAASSAVASGELTAAAVHVLDQEEPEGVRVAPNPASDRAAATLTLAMPSRVRLSAFDALGREVVRLADGPLTAGSHTFVVDRALPAGRYFIRAVVESQGGERRLFTQRLTLAR